MLKMKGMERRAVFCALLVCVALAGGCKRQRKAPVQRTDESGATMASFLHMADPKAAPQLLKGFHPIEQNAWRWTMGSFSVALHPPAQAAEKGAVLILKFAVPDPVIAKLKAVSLAASINGQALGAETYTQAGEFTYTREVPARLAFGDAVNVDFVLDKFLPPGDVDQRELGVIVTSVALETK
jgi:hypothetical protein